MSDDKFEAFSWDKKYNTGVDKVDEQHHKLVDLINQLGAISTHLADSAALGDILSELARYTIYHFDTEKSLMQQFRVDPAHQEAHVKAHAHFTAQVNVAAKLLLGNRDASSQMVSPLLKYLTNWLVQHILGLDMRMAQEIRALEAGATPDQAVRHASQVMSQSANVLLEALNEMYGRLGDKTLEVMQKNQELVAEHEALRVLNEELEERVAQRTADTEKLMQKLLSNNVELLKANEKLESAQLQLLQSEKMASIGQLAAGVAHEINNPVGFVNSNLGTLSTYLTSLFGVISAYEAVEAEAGPDAFIPVAAFKKSIDYPYLLEDIPNLLQESREGLTRVKRIVQDLKDFSHVDDSSWQYASIEQGLESTLNVVANEIKYKAVVHREYAGLPEVECLPSQLNQVFMNMLLNAAQAIETQGEITVRTGISGDEVWVEVEDTGKGISPEHLTRIFDPFFTTKPIGSGTGLGLSLSYGIVQKHHGRIDVKSVLGRGSVFRVYLPLRQLCD